MWSHYLPSGLITVFPVSLTYSLSRSFNGDESAFLEEYSEAYKSYSTLIGAIRKKQTERGERQSRRRKLNA